MVGQRCGNRSQRLPRFRRYGATFSCENSGSEKCVVISLEINRNEYFLYSILFFYYLICLCFLFERDKRNVFFHCKNAVFYIFLYLKILFVGITSIPGRKTAHPMKFITTRCRIVCAKMKSAKPRSGDMPTNCSLFSGFACRRKQTVIVEGNDLGLLNI